MFVIVDAHLQVSKVFALTFRDLNLWVPLFLTLLFLMESFIKEFILVINDEMIGAIGKWDDRSVWQTPPKASSHCNSETKLVILWCELGDIDHLWVHRCYFV
jgi:hypothetical protein